ncbi:MAG: outer membrane protein, partial [Sphingomicrobium sp.]
MRKYLLAAVAAAVIASPALARDGSPYVGIEGGILFPRNNFYDLRASDGTTSTTYNRGLQVNNKEGFDIDGIAGFDLGLFRLEGELGYKRSKVNYLAPSPGFAGDTGLTQDDLTGITNRTTVWSAMGNALIDLNFDDRTAFYAGGGIGGARVKAFSVHDNAFAWQLIAGVRTAITDNIDIGVKYRYFQTGRLHFSDTDTDAGLTFSASDKFRSHSVLASLIFNFGSVAPPPPPP